MCVLAWSRRVVWPLILRLIADSAIAIAAFAACPGAEVVCRPVLNPNRVRGAGLELLAGPLLSAGL